MSSNGELPGTANHSEGSRRSPASPGSHGSRGADSPASRSHQQPTAGHGGGSSGQGSQRIRRRNRMITSCLECRRRKLKCDKQHPCQNCTKAKRDCVFLAPALDSASQLKLTEIKEKMGTLERVLEHEVGRNGAWREARRAKQSSAEDDDYAPIPEDEKDLEPTPLSTADAMYEKGDDDVEDEMADLGFALGKMRLTDRIGGFFRPKFKEEMDVALASIPGSENIRTVTGTPESQPAAQRASTFLTPGPTYLPPSSHMFFGPAAKGQTMIDFLPASNAANLLVQQYKQAVHPIAKILHWPSFKKRYDLFWNDLRSGIEPVGSLQALVFATMFCGMVSMSEEDVLRQFAVPKAELVIHFQQGAETALGRAQFLRTTKTETMQAFVMYLIPLCRDQLSRAHSALVGTAIRLSQCMGLHRDGLAYGMGAVELQTRRMVWYQICLLDIRTCEAHGPQPGIREGDFDTKFPLNVDDDDLAASPAPTKDADYWTDMTCTLIRMECYEMHRHIWAERPRIEKKQISLTTVISRIHNFREKMQERYLPMLDLDNPVHRAARLILIILTTRLYIMVLHRYYSSTSHRIPERLRQIIRVTGLESVEAAISYETEPMLSPFRWFAGALQQYHVAFLLLTDNSAHPTNAESERIWNTVDYVFEPPMHLTRKQKSVLIVTEIRDRLEVYHAVRKMRVPLGMQKRFAHEAELMYAGSGGSTTGLGAGATQGQSPDPVPDANHIDPTGEAHVNAIMGAVGLGRVPSQPSTDWMTGLFTLPQPMTSPPLIAGDASMGVGGSSGPWQDYGGSPQFATQQAAPTAPTNLSDELMAEIDWTEWDKMFPPDMSGHQASMSLFPNDASTVQPLRYG